MTINAQVRIDWDDDGLALGLGGNPLPNLWKNSPLAPVSYPSMPSSLAEDCPLGQALSTVDVEGAFIGLRQTPSGQLPVSRTASWADINLVTYNRQTMFFLGLSIINSSYPISEVGATLIDQGDGNIRYSWHSKRSSDTSYNTTIGYDGGMPVVAEQNYSIRINYGNGGDYSLGYTGTSTLVVELRTRTTEVLLDTKTVSLPADKEFFYGSVTFEDVTIPAGSSDVYVKFLDTSSASYNCIIGGIILTNTATAEDYVPEDSPAVYAENQFDVLLEADTTYTVSWYEKEISGGVPVLEVYLPPLGEYLSVKATTTARSGASYEGWDRKGYTFTTGSDACGMVLYGDISGEEALFSGFHVVEADTLTAYPGDEYEIISEYVISANWQLGSNNFDKPTAYEGTATLLLDNQTRIFSPENVNSPLYGKFKRDLKVIIEVDGKRLWTGWTDSFQVKPGIAGKTATISCIQGHNRLRSGEFQSPVFENARIDEVIEELVVQSGGKFAPTGYRQSYLGNAYIGLNALLSDTSGIFAAVDSGLFVYEMLGDTWGDTVTVEKASKDLLQSENARMWMNRDGALELRDYLYFIPTVSKSIQSVDIGQEAISATYNYGDTVTNRIEVVLQPKQEATGELIWSSKNAIPVSAKKRVGLLFTFEEGQPRTITKVNAQQSEMDITVWKTQRTLSEDDPQSYTDAEVTDNLTVDVSEGEPGQYILHLDSNFPTEVYVDVNIYGDYLIGGDGQTYVFNSDEGEATHREVLTTRVLTTEEQAETYALYQLWQKAEARGQFTGIVIQIIDSELLDTYKIGSILKITEEQVGEQDYHAIIGEKGELQGQSLRMHYNLVGVGSQIYASENDAITLDIATPDLTDLTIVNSSGALFYTEEGGLVSFNTGRYGRFYFGGVDYSSDFIRVHGTPTDPIQPIMGEIRSDQFFGDISHLAVEGMYDTEAYKSSLRDENNPLSWFSSSRYLHKMRCRVFVRDAGLLTTVAGVITDNTVDFSFSNGVGNVTGGYVELSEYIWDWREQEVEYTPVIGNIVNGQVGLSHIFIDLNRYHYPSAFQFSPVETEVLRSHDQFRVEPSDTYYLTFWVTQAYSNDYDVVVYDQDGVVLHTEVALALATGRADFSFATVVDTTSVFLEVKKNDAADREEYSFQLQNITLMTSYPSSYADTQDTDTGPVVFL